ncbi:MAG: 1-acyl-sn-glycerol-3-phosphate acyltransferase [Saprospiraceae bacterium]
MPTTTLQEKYMTSEIRENLHIFNNIDPEFAQSLVENVFVLLNEIYFRAEFKGFDEEIKRNNPDSPVVMVSNHSGMAFPWDAIVFKSGMLKKFNFDVDKVCRTLVAPTMFQLGMFRPYLTHHFWWKCGGVPATYPNFETLMHLPNSNVLLYPEGIPGIGKGFNRKYQLQRLATSFVRMALKYKTDIVPFATVNGEYVNPYAYSFPSVNRIGKVILGLPFIPLSIVLFFLVLQPWMFYFTMPAKLTFVRGRRIPYGDLTEKEYEDLSKEEIHAIRDKVQRQIQAELTQAVEDYGKKPYNLREFFKLAWKNVRFFPFFLPFGFPFLFSEFYRQWQNKEEVDLNLGWGATLRILFRKPILLAYFIPLVGWIPIWIANAKMKKEEKVGKHQL